MNRFIMLAAAAALGWVSARGVATAAEEDLPKAEVILDKYVEVTGGRAAYEKVQTQITTGTMEFVGKGIKASLTSYKAQIGRAHV